MLPLPGWQLCRKGPAGVVGSKMSTEPLRRGCGTRVCSTRRRELQGDHTAASWFLQGGHGEDAARLCSALHGGSTRGNRHTLKPEGFRMCMGKHFLPVRTVSGRTGCLERLCRLHPWRFSRPVWTKPSWLCPGYWTRALLGPLPA